MKDSGLLGREFADSFETEEKQEEERLRDYLKRHPEDFEVWLDLIKQVEKFVRSIQKSLERNKSVYIEFLQEFRLYHPIWKKLAESYSKEANSEMVICTYEEALKFLPVNVDLWLSYCTWKMEHFSIEETRAYLYYTGCSIRLSQAAGKCIPASCSGISSWTLRNLRRTIQAWSRSSGRF